VEMWRCVEMWWRGGPTRSEPSRLVVWSARRDQDEAAAAKIKDADVITVV
jgi:hypothetical protein